MTWQKFKTITATATITSFVWILVGYYELLHLKGPESATQSARMGMTAPEQEAVTGNTAIAAEVAPPAIGHLLIPVQGVAPAQLGDTFSQARAEGERRHDAIDIPAPLGTPVLAAASGWVEKLFVSNEGGNTVYVRSADQRVIYYYAHLDHYAPGLAEGQQVMAGQVIGAVGISGNAPPGAPHLHFAINVLGPGQNWWQGTAVNPYPLLMAR
ncbi:MAG: M23 family metallopeptidase [Novosphingobium sp.]